MTRLGPLALALVLLGAAAPPSAAAAHDARLQGRWTMAGRVTRADGVRGEHRGQRVTRTWQFTSTCTTGPCSQVTLSRQRSASHVDVLTLKRTGRGVLSGSGRFYVPLKCSGRTYKHGGVAFYTVRVAISRDVIVQGKRFATRIGASYSNTKRVNHTPCRGALGRDAGTYSGRLSSAVPAPPTAEFNSASDPVSGDASFSDTSSSPTGAKIVRWRWSFGDPASGANNASSDQNPTHHYPASGTYEVTLTVTDANGLTAKVSRQVVV